MYLRSIRIENFRCFADSEATFHTPGADSPLRIPNVNLILGGNGAGKSTLLKAIALGFLGPILSAAGFRSLGNVRQGMTTARVRARARQAGQEVALPVIEVQKQGDYEQLRNSESGSLIEMLANDESPELLLAGYGAGRRVETEWFSESTRLKERGLRYQQVASLFENGYALRPLGSWLGESPRQAQVIELLNRVLPEDVRLVEVRGAELVFDSYGAQVNFGGLSDGYRAFVAWVGDLLWSLSRLSGIDPFEREAMVLVDELDLHLHPEWQRSVVETLAQAFPKIQFFFTSHSPILAATLEKANIYVMETAEDGSSLIRQREEEVFGQDTEQVLLSSYFGLETTRPESFELEQRELAARSSAVNPQVAIEMMKRLARR